MATLAEIKTQLDIENLILTPVGDTDPDFLSYKNDEKKIHILIHRELAEKIQINSSLNLKLKTTSTNDPYTCYRIFESSSIYNKEIRQSSINIDGISSKLKLDRLSNNEIIVMSVVVGTIIALIIGFAFENYYYYHNGLKLYSDDKNDYAEFNYLASVASFIISGGITYLFLKRKNKMQ